MFQAVVRRPFTTEAWVQFQASPCGVCGVKSDTGTGFARSTPFSPFSNIPPKLHTYLRHNTNVIRRTSGRSLGTLKRTMRFGMSGSTEEKIMFMLVVCFFRHLLTECWERWTSWFLSASPFRHSDVRSASSSAWPGCATWLAERATWSKPSPTYTSGAWLLHQQL
jgi:hypothetical protein